MHTHPLASYMEAIYRSDWSGVGELMLSSAGKLAAIGAEFLICPDNTIHRALPAILPRSPLPWLHIADVVAGEAASRGFRTLALTGMRWLVDGPVYPEALAARGLACIRPSEDERDEINRIIMEDLVYRRFRAEAVAGFRRIIARLGTEGCVSVILGSPAFAGAVRTGPWHGPTRPSSPRRRGHPGRRGRSWAG